MFACNTQHSYTGIKYQCLYWRYCIYLRMKAEMNSSFTAEIGFTERQKNNLSMYCIYLQVSLICVFWFFIRSSDILKYFKDDWRFFPLNKVFQFSANESLSSQASYGLILTWYYSNPDSALEKHAVESAAERGCAAPLLLQLLLQSVVWRQRFAVCLWR